MKLYEIDQSIEDLFAVYVDADTGEFDEEGYMAALEELSKAKEEKLESIALWIKNLDSDAKAIREEEKALASRRYAMENKSYRLKKFLAMYLNGEKFSTAKCAVSYRKSTAVEVDDLFVPWAETNAPELLKVKSEADKDAIKKAIAAGAELDFARICEKNNISIK